MSESFQTRVNGSFQHVWKARWKTFLVIVLVMIAIAAVLVGIAYYRDIPVTTSEVQIFLLALGGVIAVYFAFGLSGILLASISNYLAESSKARQLPLPVRPPRTLGYIAYTVLTGFSSLWTGYTSYLGIQILFFTPDQGLKYYILPAMAGVLLTVMVFAFWTTMFNAVSRTPLVQRLLVLFIVVPVGGAVIFAASTATSVMGMGGDAAIARHMIQSVEQQQTSLNAAYNQRLTDISTVKPIVNQLAERYRIRAKDERELGVHSQSAGLGQVSAYLNDVANGFENELNQLSSAESDLKARYNDINGTLKDMRDDLQLRGVELQEVVRGMVADLNEINSQVLNIADTVMIKSTLVNIQNIGKTQPLQAVSDKGDLAKRQEDAASRIQRDLQADTSQVIGVLQERISLPAQQVPKFEPMSAILAIIHFWYEIWLSWGVAIAADFGPFILILLAVVVGGRTVEYEEAQPENKPELRVVSAA